MHDDSLFPEIEPQETIRRETWPEGQTVTIRTYLGGYDRDRILSATSASATDEEGRRLLIPRLHEAKQTMLEVAVVSWTLSWPVDPRDPAKGRKPVPCTPEMLKRLGTEDKDFIIERAKEAWARWDRPTSVTPAMTQEEAVAADKRDRVAFQQDA